MALYTYNINDPHDRPEDIRIAALKIQAPDIIASHNFAKELRQLAWENRKITNGGSLMAGSDLQYFAKIPAKVVELWNLRYPDWQTDDDLLLELINKYPECRTIPEEMTK